MTAPLSVRVSRFPLPGGTGRETAGTSEGPEAPPAGGAARGRLGILVELRDRAGRPGWGEASPLPSSAPETPEQASGTLLLVAADSRFQAGHAELERDPAGTVARLLSRDGNRGDGSRGLVPEGLPASARAALVCAVLDYAARRSGRPVRESLTAGTASGRPVPPVPLNALVPLRAGAPGAIEAASTALKRGIRTLKVKLSGAGAFERELEVLRELRGAVGPEVALRLDVNRLWTLSEARALLPRLAAELRPEYVEEPVRPGELLELLDAPVPLAADESLADGDTAARLLDAGVVSVFVLKPGRLGGVDRCLDLARAADAAGIATVVTHAFEGPVGHAAACELALALSALRADDPAGMKACGLDGHGALAAWEDIVVPQLRGAAIVPAEVSGLGVDAGPLAGRRDDGTPG